jgi:hypothetical protein
MAVITALSHDDSVTSAKLVAGVRRDDVRLLVAHVLRGAGQRMEGEGAPTFANMPSPPAKWPLVEASLLPVLCACSGRRPREGRHAAIAIGAGVVGLFGYGIAAGRRLHPSRGGVIPSRRGQRAGASCSCC